MPVEYKLMTCFPKAFPVFSPFSFSSRCLYSAYVLLMISSLALSTLSCVNLCPNKCALPMLMMFFKHSRFLCRSILSFGVSTMSPKNSLSFNMSPKSAIIFIKCRNRHHMKNSLRYKGNINNTSVIIFLIGGQKTPSNVTLLGRTSSEVFVILVVVVHSFLFFIWLLFFIYFVLHFCWCSSFTFAFRHHPSPFHGLIAGLLHPFYTFSPAHRRVIRDTFIFNHSVIFLPWPLRLWVGIFYPQTFFTLCSFTDILPELIKAFLRAGSSSLKLAGLHNDPWNTDPAHLFVWFTVIHNLHIQNDSFLNSTKY